MSNVAQRRERAILIASIICMSYALLLRADIALQQATAPAPRPHAVLRVMLPGIDIGADAAPATAGASGYVELWIYPHDADDYRPLLQLPGAPALPVALTPRAAPGLGEISA